MVILDPAGQLGNVKSKEGRPLQAAGFSVDCVSPASWPWTGCQSASCSFSPVKCPRGGHWWGGGLREVIAVPLRRFCKECMNETPWAKHLVFYSVSQGCFKIAIYFFMKSMWKLCIIRSHMQGKEHTLGLRLAGPWETVVRVLECCNYIIRHWPLLGEDLKIARQ